MECASFSSSVKVYDEMFVTISFDSNGRMQFFVNFVSLFW